MLTIHVTVPGRVWEDALDPDASTMQDELGLPRPERQRAGSGWRAIYRDVPVAVARELAEYLHDRADTLLGQRYSDDEQRERDVQRAAIRSAAKIRAEIQRAQIRAAEPGGLLLDVDRGVVYNRD